MKKKTSIVVTQQAYEYYSTLPNWIKKGRFIALLLGWEADDVVLFIRPGNTSQHVKDVSQHLIQACKEMQKLHIKLYNRGINF